MQPDNVTRHFRVKLIKTQADAVPKQIPKSFHRVQSRLQVVHTSQISIYHNDQTKTIATPKTFVSRRRKKKRKTAPIIKFWQLSKVTRLCDMSKGTPTDCMLWCTGGVMERLQVKLCTIYIPSKEFKPSSTWLARSPGVKCRRLPMLCSQFFMTWDVPVETPLRNGSKSSCLKRSAALPCAKTSKICNIRLS
eukprot:4496364-Amphidinium_carterae.1